MENAIVSPEHHVRNREKRRKKAYCPRMGMEVIIYCFSLFYSRLYAKDPHNIATSALMNVNQAQVAVV